MEIQASVLSPTERAQVEANLGVLYRRLGDPIKALQTYREAQRFFSLQQDSDGELGVLKNIGIVLALDLNDLHQALKTFRQVLILAQRSGNGREVVQARWYTAEVLRLLNRMGEAEAEFKLALEGAQSLGATEEQWKALYGLGLIENNRGNNSQAQSRLREAIGIIESVRSRLRAPSLTAGFLADKRDVYDALIEAILKSPLRQPLQKRAQEIFELMERARARTFRDQLDDALVNLQARSNPELGRRLRELRAQAALLWSRQLRAKPAERMNLHGQMIALENQYLFIERQLHESSKQPGAETFDSLEAIQSRLGEGTLMVEIWVGRQEMALLGLTRHGVELNHKEFTPAISQKISSCVGRFASGPLPGWQQACEGLGEYFFAGFSAFLTNSKIQTVIFVPDDLVALFPFEVLPLPSGRDLLIERVSVFYLPSAWMLAEPAPSRQVFQRMPWEKSLLAFGAPEISQKPGAYAGTWRLNEEGKPLPHSGVEVNGIARQVTGRAELHLGKDALKAYLFDQRIKSFPLIHFSTHGAIDSENPQRSYLLFSPATREGPADYLFMQEVFNLNLGSVDLVTLSACDTARGKMLRGEGAQDFSRAFLMSGARATVASLWRVSDQPTADLMKQFYFFLDQGRCKAEALRQAKLQFVHSRGALAHPYYWAGFVLNGDGFSSVQLPFSWAASFAGLAGIFALTSLLLFLVNRGRNYAGQKIKIVAANQLEHSNR